MIATAMLHVVVSARACPSVPRRYFSALIGKYVHARKILDYTWHVHYSPERQILQDEIVSQFVEKGRPHPSPWVVFTAGAMGAGKSWTMRYFDKQGIFPLSKFVVVDPDRIRACIPEMHHYKRHNQMEAVSLTQREAGYIAEVVQTEAMMQGKNVLVDGTLRNHHWYSRLFKEIRKNFPIYRIGILMVTAPRDVVHSRAAKRASVTGRVVPTHVIDETIDQVPIAFEHLAPLADYTAIIDNAENAKAPAFRPPATLESFKALWADMMDGADAGRADNIDTVHEV